MVAPVIAGAAVVAKLAYKPAMKLAKSLAKKYWSKGSNKEKIVKEAKNKGILEKFNNFKLKNDPSKPLKQNTKYSVKPTGGKKPNMSQQESRMAYGGKTKMAGGGDLKDVPSGNKGLGKLPTAVRNKMGFKKYGGKAKMMGGGKVHMKKYAKGGGMRKAMYK